MSTQITLIPAVKLEINTTPILGGSAGQILFQTIGNTVGESANLFWNNTDNALSLIANANLGASALSGLIVTNTNASGYANTLWYNNLNDVGQFMMTGSTAVGFTGTNILTRQANFINATGTGGINLLATAGNITFNAGGGTVSKVTMFTSGNVAINTTTDAGFKLDVNGATRVTGIGTTSASTSFQVVNSAGSVPFKVLGNGNVEMPFSASLQFDFSCRIISSNGGVGSQGLLLRSQNYGNASGTIVTLAFAGSPAGGAIGNGMEINGVTLQSATFNNYNVTGDFTNSVGSNTIVGYLFNPVLNASFSTVNTIAIKTVIGNVQLNTTSGNTLIGTTTDAGFKLDVNGTARVQGNATFGATGTSAVLNFARASSGSTVGAIIQTERETEFHNYQGGGIKLITDNVTYLHVKGFASQFAANVTGALTSNAGFTRALLVNNVINANANNVELAAVYISPTFNNLAFTGVKNIAIQSASGGAHFNTTSVNDSSILQADSTTQGFLPPRMTTTQKNAIATPATGLELFDITTLAPSIYNGTNWQDVLVPNSAGNVGIGTSSPATGLDARSGFNLWVGGGHYLEPVAVSGTDVSVRLRRTLDNGWVRYALGANSVVQLGANISTGESQLFVAFGGFFQTFYSNGSERMRIFTSGNVAINTTTDAGFKLDVNGTARVSGQATIQTLTIGLGNNSVATNTVVGLTALNVNTTGEYNSAFGGISLQKNTSGNYNTALGYQTLNSNTSGTNNTAVGMQALNGVTIQSNNTGVGFQSLNSGGANNSALGASTDAGGFSGSVILGRSAVATGANQFVVGSTGTNAGAVVSQVNTSTQYWEVIINGVTRKVLLA